MRSPIAKQEIRALTEQRAKILRLRESGMTVTLLAVRFSTSEERIRKVLKAARKEKGDATAMSPLPTDV